MATIAVTAKSGSLAQSLKATGSDSTIVIQSKESWASVADGVVKIGEGDNREWVSFVGLSEIASNTIYTITLSNCQRGLKKNAANITDVLSTNKKNNGVGQPVSLVWHSVNINNLAGTGENNVFTGNNTVTGSFTFVSTTIGALRLQNVTTAQRTSLTGLQNGVLVYDTDADTPYIYSVGVWYPLSTGSVQPNATETTKGNVELGTVADQQNATITGESGAATVVQTRYLVQASAGAVDAYKIPILNSLGKFDDSVMPSSVQKFGGDGSDGSVNGAVTITGSNSTYIVKNYTTFIPGSNTVTVIPQDCVVHIKVSGDADLTNTTFDFDGKGAVGGDYVSGVFGVNLTGFAGNAGSDASTYLPMYQPKKGLGGGVSANTNVTPATGGAAGTTPYPVTSYQLLLGSRMIAVAPGAGGGSGASGGTGAAGFGTDTSGYAGKGGNGGGCLILEVAGNITCASTTIQARGQNGDTGGAFQIYPNSGPVQGFYGGSGGGGGGSGGTVVVLYGGSLTGTLTPIVTGGIGAVGTTGVVQNARSSAGGGGASSIAANGAAGATITGFTLTGGTGGNGANGISIVEKNTVFQ